MAHSLHPAFDVNEAVIYSCYGSSLFVTDATLSLRTIVSELQGIDEPFIASVLASPNLNILLYEMLACFS